MLTWQIKSLPFYLWHILGKESSCAWVERCEAQQLQGGSTVHKSVCGRAVTFLHTIIVKQERNIVR